MSPRFSSVVSHFNTAIPKNRRPLFLKTDTQADKMKAIAMKNICTVYNFALSLIVRPWWSLASMLANDSIVVLLSWGAALGSDPGLYTLWL